MHKITQNIGSKQQALASYLSFIEQGALLVEPTSVLNFQEIVRLQVHFPELKQEICCDGKVVWISAKDIQGKAHFGIQPLGAEGALLHESFENYLAGMLND